MGLNLTADELQEGFSSEGFLSDVMGEFARAIREDQAPHWFDLADDVSATLTRAAFRNSKTAAFEQTSFQQRPVAHAVLLRSIANFQGVILLAERGMVTPARCLARSCLEDAFAMAGLHHRPEDFLQHLRDEESAARRGKAKAVLATGDDRKYDAAALHQLIARSPRGKGLGVNEVAELGPLSNLYLAYKVLSDDGAHVTVTNLARNMNFSPDGKEWGGFSVGPSTTREIVEALNFALMAFLSVGVAYSNVIGDSQVNQELDGLSDRYHALPQMSHYA